MIVLCVGLQSAAFAAEQDWWFDVEVIVFKRETSVTELSEKFANSDIKAPSPKVIDILSPYLQPDLSYVRAGLSFCRASERAKKQQELLFTQPKTSVVQHAERSKKTEQDDFQYQVMSADIFDEPNINRPSTDQGEIKQNEVPNRVQDLSVNWIEWQIPQQLPCVYREQLALLSNPFEPKEQNVLALAKLDAVPVKIDGHPWQQNGHAFLIPQSELTLGSLYKGINKQRDLQTILHMGWRQEVKFGQDKTQAIRLFAGKNYGQTFLTNGHRRPAKSTSPALPYIPLAEQHHLSMLASSVLKDQAALQKNEDLLSAFYHIINNDEPLNLAAPIDYHNKFQSKGVTDSDEDLPAEAIWQLDGNIKVYLQNVGATPYLHIASNLDYRQPIFDQGLVKETGTNNATVMTGNQSREPNLIQSVNFNQFKRVISKQLHYFDHPLFGMVVHITRYNWPDTPTSNK
ncbi:CsiV family protein [Paraglaciecola sp.]|uniref:CsiV family protein n=1 Tax=Paraglaciecola sp. TaxID=1920173 RepID=UPI0030F3DC19